MTKERLLLTDTFEAWAKKFNGALDDIDTAIENIPSLDKLAPKNHASEENTYGVGNSTLYGHIKLSDDIDSESNVENGVGATPSAVKKAYDKANAAQNTANSAMEKASTIFAGSTPGLVPEATPADARKVLLGDGTWDNTNLEPMSEKAQSLGSVSGDTSIDLSAGLAISATIAGATTFSLTNPPSTGSVAVVMQLTNGGSAAVTWPTSIKWSGGTAPKLTAAGIDIIVLTTSDAGVTWYGIVNLKYA